MSHASVIVALSPENIAEHGDINTAVEWNMEPFKEGSWFEDGSRWDQFVIGGRFTGKFAEPSYDPSKDPKNLETCWLCKGGGMRNDALGREDRRTNPAYTCNGCDGTGKMVKFPTKWEDVGNIAVRGDIKREGIKAFAFLRNRVWHEQGRLGWFGGSAATECERKAVVNGETYEGKCLHVHEETGAKIISFGDEVEERWDSLYFARFLRNLPDNWTLVCVDYHV